MPISAELLILHEFSFVIYHASDTLLDVLLEDAHVRRLDRYFLGIDQLPCLFTFTDIVKKFVAKSV